MSAPSERRSSDQLDAFLRSYSGFDGGDPAAQVWICGIEFAGAPGPLPFPPEPQHAIPEWANDFRTKYPQYKRWQFHQKVAKLYLAIRSWSESPNSMPDISAWRELLHSNLYARHSNTFKLNLFPLDSSGVKDEQWAEVHRREPLLSSKDDYYARCRRVRFPFLEATRRTHKPRVVIGVGLSFAEDFANALGFAPPQDTGAIVADGVSIPCRMSPPDGGGSLLVVPFFGRRYGLNSDALIIETARRVARLLSKSD